MQRISLLSAHTKHNKGAVLVCTARLGGCFSAELVTTFPSCENLSLLPWLELHLVFFSCAQCQKGSQFKLLLFQQSSFYYYKCCWLLKTYMPYFLGIHSHTHFYLTFRGNVISFLKLFEILSITIVYSQFPKPL